jgi:Fe-S-cluster containining protein
VNISVMWGVTSCILVDIYTNASDERTASAVRVEEHSSIQKLAVACSINKLLTFYQNTRCRIQEDRSMFCTEYNVLANLERSQIFQKFLYT